MKPPHLHLCIGASILVTGVSATAANETLAIVEARVEEVNMAPPTPDSRDDRGLREGLSAPVGEALWMARLSVERVRSGDASLVGPMMWKNVSRSDAPSRAPESREPLQGELLTHGAAPPQVPSDNPFMFPLSFREFWAIWGMMTVVVAAVAYLMLRGKRARD